MNPFQLRSGGMTLDTLKLIIKEDLEDMRRKPSHPGRLLKNILKERNESLLYLINNGSKVEHYIWVDFVNEKWSLGTKMANELAIMFDMTPEAWLNAQRLYDKWVEENDS